MPVAKCVTMFKIINTNSDNYNKNLKPAVKSAKSNCNILLDESKISRDWECDFQRLSLLVSRSH